jgi:Skp family chaperone for outer membrane proteins
MKHFWFIILILSCPAFIAAQESIATKAIENELAGSSQIPLEKYDTTAVVPVPSDNNEPTKAPDFNPTIDMNAPQGTPDFTPQAPEPKSLPKDNRLLGFKPSKDYKEEVPKDSPVAIYIDMQEAFNKNPWTIEARKKIKLALENKQVEYAQLKKQIADLQTELETLEETFTQNAPFYEKADYILPEKNQYPCFETDRVKPLLNELCFASWIDLKDSPINQFEQEDSLRKQIAKTEQELINKQTFLLNFKARSSEEFLSRQDFVIQEILKEIYSGIEEYATLRNVGVVVDKTELIYGKPLDATQEFVKWMKNYHKKYIEKNGELYENLKANS